MGVRDSLRKAEEQGREAARRTLESARASWEDAERRIRRNKRIHPKRSVLTPKATPSATPGSDLASVPDSSVTSREAAAAANTYTADEHDFDNPAA